MKATPTSSGLKTALLNRVILPPPHIMRMARNLNRGCCKRFLLIHLQTNCENHNLFEKLIGEQTYRHDNAVYDTSLGPCQVQKTRLKSSVAL